MALTKLQTNGLAANVVVESKIGSDAVTTSKLNSNIILKGATTVLSGIIETANVISSNVTSNINIDKFSSSVIFYQNNATSNANVTINFTNFVNVPVGNVSSFVVIIKNNANFQALVTDTQIEGNPGNTANWLSAAPSAGTANLDVYSFSVIKTADSDYTILANKSNFN